MEYYTKQWKGTTNTHKSWVNLKGIMLNDKKWSQRLLFHLYDILKKPNYSDRDYISVVTKH